MHAQGEEQPDGFRAYSCIGVVLQDYSKGKGDKTVRVTANLSPGFFPFALSRMQNDLDKFDFHEEKIFGEPDEHGLSTVTKLSIKRATIGTDGKPRNYPWCIILENGRAVKEQMILSHHGEPEFGAAVKPICAESELLSQIDMIDSRMEIYRETLANLQPGEVSNRVFALDKRVYKP